ncbi:AraC family transcriptional regulator [Paenibacillus antri]|nr:AraC family transcriptional regulator [Paenibacillus antri]
MKQGAYAFRYAEAVPFLRLDSIGWQYTDDPGYGHHGMTRPDRGHVIFQYTLSGEGKLRYGGETWSVPPGSGILVTVPGDYRYYWEKDSGAPWEFLWINMAGEDAARLAERIRERHGPVVRLSPRSRAIRRGWELYRTVSEDRVTDAVELSTQAYGFLVSMLEQEAADAPAPDLPAPLRKATRLMKERFREPLGLEEIAAHSGVSAAYLCRLFQSRLGVSPLEYMRRRRVEAAVTLLRRTDESVSRIGELCGFESPSYFGKVFRQYLGLSPRQFRNDTNDHPYETLFLE